MAIFNSYLYVYQRVYHEIREMGVIFPILKIHYNH